MRGDIYRKKLSFWFAICLSRVDDNKRLNKQQCILFLI